MTFIRIGKLIFILGLITQASLTYAEEKIIIKNRIGDEQRIIRPRVNIYKYKLEQEYQLPGSGYYVDDKQIKQAGTNDINHVIRQVPGINIQEEDGFGLRPNIGMRGGRIDRSADITLMEDGVLIAPAPYAAPEAYYFPRIGRMQGIEVLKGSSSIKYGPRTTNGAVNLLTRSIPDSADGEISTSAGSYEGFRSSLRSGTSTKLGNGNFGILVEAHDDRSKGFKKIDFVGGNTGYEIQDYMMKMKYKTGSTSDLYQELELKLGYNDEDSDETYLGLTTEDFRANHKRRYAASQFDNFDSHHNQMQLTHHIEPLNNLSFTTTAYRNDFNRNWYKLQSVRVGADKRNINDILDNPETYAAHLAILKGGDSASNGLQIRLNNRDYYSQGLQNTINYKINLFNVANNIELGIRYHYDRQDRFQRDDEYQMIGGRMRLTSYGAPGSESNRIGTGEALAGFVQNRMEYGDLAITPGLRYEYVRLHTRNYGTSDPGRSGANLQHYRSTIKAAIPGVGIEYNIGQNWQILAGAHKGFAPPEPPTSTSGVNAKKEESVNYELGARYKLGKLKTETIGFFTDYKNLLGADTLSSGAGGSGDQFNGGKVHVYGLEASAGYDMSEVITKSPYKLPVKIGYTYTKAEFQSNFNSTFAEWGNVIKGYKLPYISPHQIYVSFGVEDENWSVSTSAKYMDRMRTVAGSGPVQKSRSTDRHIVLDVSGDYKLHDNATAFMSINNLLDEKYIAARRPAGARPGSPQMIFAGVKIHL